jgi:hypothetical protein
MSTEIPPNSKPLFKAVCIKEFKREKCWPVLRPLVVYEFYYCVKGYLSVYADQITPTPGRTHGLFWVGNKESENYISFDEYFIKIEGEENGKPDLDGDVGTPEN